MIWIKVIFGWFFVMKYFIFVFFKVIEYDNRVEKVDKK